MTTTATRRREPRCARRPPSCAANLHVTWIGPDPLYRDLARYPRRPDRGDHEGSNGSAPQGCWVPLPSRAATPSSSVARFPLAAAYRGTRSATCPSASPRRAAQCASAIGGHVRSGLLGPRRLWRCRTRTASITPRRVGVAHTRAPSPSTFCRAGDCASTRTPASLRQTEGCSSWTSRWPGIDTASRARLAPDRRRGQG